MDGPVIRTVSAAPQSRAAHTGKPKVGWLHIGHKGEKFRDIDLLNEARRPLYDYLRHGWRDQISPYVFTSQRHSQLTETGTETSLVEGHLASTVRLGGVGTDCWRGRRTDAASVVARRAEGIHYRDRGMSLRSPLIYRIRRPFKTGCWTVSYPVHTGSDASRGKRIDRVNTRF